MPFVKYTYPKDVRRFGSDPVEVTDRHAELIVRDRRGVVVDSHDELESETKAELVAKAVELGKRVPAKAKKPELVKLVEDAQAAEGQS